MTRIRTLPIRLAPVEGEPLDSWLEALAYRSDAAWTDILAAVGLSPGRFGTFPWIIRVPAAQAALISAATGVSIAAVHAMTLAHFDQTPLRTTTPELILSRVFPWARTGGSRYCPQCLAESGGRWQLTWRLGWSFACLKHSCLLADVCPKCIGAQRIRAMPTRHTPMPGLCARPTTDGDRQSHTRCGGALTEVATPQLGRDHPILQAQRTLCDIFHSGVADLGRYRHTPQPSMHALADLRHTAAYLLAKQKRATIDKVAGLDRLGVSYDARHALIKSACRTTWQAQQWAITPHASIAAVGITAAVVTMRTPPAGPPHATAARYRAARPAAEGTALGTAVRPSDELRYRTNKTATRNRQTPSSRVDILVRRTPTMLWPAWSLRFASPHCAQSQARPALSVFLLLVDNRLRLSDAVALMHSPIDGSSCSRILQLLSNRTDWPETRTALGRLADYLADHDTPIDYQRRRHLNYAALLPDQAWARICRDTCTPAPYPARARIVRYYLYERLSGLPVIDFPSVVVGPEMRTKLNNFPLHLTSELANALEEHCRNFLADNHIDDEPPFWSPPTDILADLKLPGYDPDDVDIAAMQRLIADTEWSGSRIAKRLKTTLPVVRHLSERNPATVSPTTDLQQTRAVGGARKKAKSILAPEDLAKLYLQDRRSLREVAADVGVDRKIIAQLAHEYGIELRPPRQSPHRVVDRDWLYEQYVVKRRTLPDIATQCEMSPTNMARWAKRHGIPLRSRGGVSHRDHLADQIAAETAPLLLRPALAGVGGWERLEDFSLQRNSLR
jgi:hypothetical protein